jgi:hypothetical protein
MSMGHTILSQHRLPSSVSPILSKLFLRTALGDSRRSQPVLLCRRDCLNWSIPVSTSVFRYPERCILSTSSFSSSIISLIMVQLFHFLSKETITSLRGGSLFTTGIEQMGAYNGHMERVSVSISKRCRKQRIGQKR